MDVALKVLVLTISAPASMNSRWMSPINAGRVIASRSLQPLRSRGEVGETLAAIGGFVQLVLLDHGAHGTVEHHDALLE